MLTVKTTVQPSPIAGLGLFAAEEIKAGSLLWKWTPGLDTHFYIGLVKSWPLELRQFAFTYCWESALVLKVYKTSWMCLSADGARYMNHSTKPNCVSDTTVLPPTIEAEYRIYASRDIHVGEEITYNYYSFECTDECRQAADDAGVLDEYLTR